MASPRRSFADIIEELVTRAGSQNALIRAMKKAGASVTTHAVQNWRRGSQPYRKDHIIVVAWLAGMTVEDVLWSALAPEKRKELLSKKEHAILPSGDKGAEQ